MPVNRLTSKFWIDAYSKRLEAAAIPVFVIKKGDDKAGAIFIRVSNLSGQAILFSQTCDPSGRKVWFELANGTDHEIESAITRQIQFDPDLWVLEVEEKNGRHLLDEISKE